MGLKTGYKDVNGVDIRVGDTVRKWRFVGKVIIDAFGFGIKCKDGWVENLEDMCYVGRNKFEIIKEQAK